MEELLRRRLEEIVGPSGVGSDDVVRASNVTQLREVLAACAASGVSAAPSGPATAGRHDLLISIDRLDAVRLDAPALLLRAGAASSWTAVREAAAAKRLAVAGVGSVRSERVGASVVQGEIPHRALAGVDLLTWDGVLISAGGRTLKDVVGYDLAGLVLGSGDRLGVVVAATLRLEPVGARSMPEPGPGPWRGDAGLDVALAFHR